MKTVLCLLFQKNKFAIVTCITKLWLNQPINFYRGTSIDLKELMLYV